MKISHILYFSILAFSSKSFAQKLSKGKFSYSGGYEGKGLTIKSENRFEFISWTCTGGHKGSGHYTIKDSSLCLIFENEHKIDSMLSINYEPTNKDSTEILLRFKDLEDKSFIDEGVVIKVKKNNNVISGTYSISRVSSIKIPKDSLPVSLEIYVLGYSKRQIKIDSNGKYEILCSLEANFLNNYSLGDSLFFVLNKYNRKQIQMRTKDYEKGYFIVYSRNKSWLQKMLFRKKKNQLVTVVKKN